MGHADRSGVLVHGLRRTRPVASRCGHRTAFTPIPTEIRMCAPPRRHTAAIDGSGVPLAVRHADWLLLGAAGHLGSDLRRAPVSAQPAEHVARVRLPAGDGPRQLGRNPASHPKPGLSYASLAEDTVEQVAEYCELAGRTVVDVGGGGGWFTAAFRARGANCYLFEPDPTELHSRKSTLPGAVVADGYWLPVRDGAADVVFSSNVL